MTDTKVSAQTTYPILKASLALNLKAGDEQAAHWFNDATKSQIGQLVRLFVSYLGKMERPLRLAILSELIGYPIGSFKDLTKWEASILIDYLRKSDSWEVSQDGAILFEGARYAVTARSLLSQGFEGVAQPQQDHQFVLVMPGLPPPAGRKSGDA